MGDCGTPALFQSKASYQTAGLCHWLRDICRPQHIRPMSTPHWSCCRQTSIGWLLYNCIWITKQATFFSSLSSHYIGKVADLCHVLHSAEVIILSFKAWLYWTYFCFVCGRSGVKWHLSGHSDNDGYVSWSNWAPPNTWRNSTSYYTNIGSIRNYSNTLLIWEYC